MAFGAEQRWLQRNPHVSSPENITKQLQLVREHFSGFYPQQCQIFKVLVLARTACFRSWHIKKTKKKQKKKKEGREGGKEGRREEGREKERKQRKRKMKGGKEGERRGNMGGRHVQTLLFFLLRGNDNVLALARNLEII